MSESQSYIHRGLHLQLPLPEIYLPMLHIRLCMPMVTNSEADIFNRTCKVMDSLPLCQKVTCEAWTVDEGQGRLSVTAGYTTCSVNGVL